MRTANGAVERSPDFTEVNLRTVSNHQRMDFPPHGGVLLLLQFLRHASDEKLRVQVEAVGALRALAVDVRLLVDAEDASSAVPRDLHLMPVTLADLDLAGQRAGA